MRWLLALIPLALALPGAEAATYSGSLSFEVSQVRLAAGESRSFNLTADLRLECDRQSPGGIPFPPPTSPPPIPDAARLAATSGASHSVGDAVVWDTSPREASLAWKRSDADQWVFEARRSVLITATSHTGTTANVTGTLSWGATIPQDSACGPSYTGTIPPARLDYAITPLTPPRFQGRDAPAAGIEVLALAVATSFAWGRRWGGQR